MQDADLEYDPHEIADVIGPILENKADVVYGSRFMVKKAARVLYFSHYPANKSFSFCSNCLTNLNMSDIETCYKAFRGEIIRYARITWTGALAVLGQKEKRRYAWLLVFPVLCVPAVSLITFGDPRFRHPVDLSFVILAAIGVSVAAGRLQALLPK